MKYYTLHEGGKRAGKSYNWIQRSLEKMGMRAKKVCSTQLEPKIGRSGFVFVIDEMQMQKLIEFASVPNVRG